MKFSALAIALAMACSPAGALAQDTSQPTQPSNPAPATDTSSVKSPSGVQIDSKSLVGSTVRGEDGKDVGKVANVMIDPSDGKVTALVVTMGRTVGVGGTGVTLNGKDITVPWDGVKVGRDRDKFIVTLLQGALPAADSSTKSR
jgi:sporulation protein YlmC with PRC-barrel domain